MNPFLQIDLFSPHCLWILLEYLHLVFLPISVTEFIIVRWLDRCNQGWADFPLSLVVYVLYCVWAPLKICQLLSTLSCCSGALVAITNIYIYIYIMAHSAGPPPCLENSRNGARWDIYIYRFLNRRAVGLELVPNVKQSIVNMKHAF